MNYLPVGTRIKDNICSFTVWAPFKKKVEVLLEDTGIRYPMVQFDYGYWKTDLPEVQAGALYSFILDEDKRFPDPASRQQPQGVHGPSSVASDGFSWTDQLWTGLSLG